MDPTLDELSARSAAMPNGLKQTFELQAHRLALEVLSADTKSLAIEASYLNRSKSALSLLLNA
jgi:hypothetical protein